MKQQRTLLTLMLMLTATCLMGQLRLPAIIADHMVLQADKPANIWGWASKGQKVTVTIGTHRVDTRAGRKGAWHVALPPMTYGGPYTMTVAAGKEAIRVTDILVGEVWVASGQSNMEFRLSSANRADEEIATATNTQIREFEAAHALSRTPNDDLTGHWTVSSPQSAGSFSAVAYLFAKEVASKLGCPVGIVKATWGGTDIEAWMSLGAMNRLPQYSQLMKELSTSDITANEALGRKVEAQFAKAVATERGEAEGWYAPTWDKSHWAPLPVPGVWTVDSLAKIDGVVWATTQFNVPEAMAGREAVISLGMIDDDDATWVNGHRIGSTKGYTTIRRYSIPAGLLKTGLNELTIRIVDNHGNGGCYGPKHLYYLQVGDQQLSILDNPWKYRIAVVKDMMGYVPESPNRYPSRIFNAMVAPICRYRVKGTLWYQGENNTDRAQAYAPLFQSMITDWRQQWRQTDMPFYWVQLANYKKAATTPTESDWATLRAAQNAALALPHTGQAVIIDVGEANDIHPHDKQTVAHRLALMALRNDYGQTGVYCDSPQPVEAHTDAAGNVIVTFDHVARGLKAHNRYGYVNAFAIAGTDGHYQWAQAEVVGLSQIRIRTPRGMVPAKVRYAWADNPDDANLYNSAGLPATPFELKIDRQGTAPEPQL